MIHNKDARLAVIISVIYILMSGAILVFGLYDGEMPNAYAIFPVVDIKELTNIENSVSEIQEIQEIQEYNETIPGGENEQKRS